jgi:hypothetical protein
MKDIGAGPNGSDLRREQADESEAEADIEPTGESFVDDSMFARTKRLGYEARIAALRAEANGNFPALIVDPIESEMWYVRFPEDYLTTKEDEDRLTKIFERVIKWSNELAEEEKEQIRKASGGNGGTQATSA